MDTARPAAADTSNSHSRALPGFLRVRHNPRCPDSAHYRYDNVTALRTFSSHLRPGGRRGLLPAGTADAVFRTDSSLALVRFHVVHKNRYITGLKNPMAAF